MMKALYAMAAVALLSLAAVGVSQADSSGFPDFTASLSGGGEVPPRETGASGKATFRLNDDESQVSFKLAVSDIENVVAAHIHCGAVGVNGPVIVFLAGPFASGGGAVDGALSEGDFGAGDVLARGDSAECPGGVADLADVIAKMRAGDAYVNVHTSDGVEPDNTGPGDFPGGEIRGQIAVASAPLCFGEPVTIFGTEGDDVINGTARADVIYGLEGNDIIRGMEDDDVICGGEGDDVLLGNQGNDKLDGGSGDDTLNGGFGRDIVHGGTGDDHVAGGWGAGDESDIVSGGPGHDFVFGGPGNDRLWGGAGRDFLYGGGGDDTLNGNDNWDRLRGGGAEDSLRGGPSRDFLQGGAGDDALDGGEGTDQCEGGPGSDTIVNCEVAALIKDFILPDLTVAVGTTVTWINEDFEPHTATSGESPDLDGLWDSPSLDQGESFSHAFNETGSFPYFCRIHPFMQATVKVE